MVGRAGPQALVTFRIERNRADNADPEPKFDIYVFETSASVALRMIFGSIPASLKAITTTTSLQHITVVAGLYE
jgi:hypothetical protein